MAWAQLVTKQKKEPWYGEEERTCDTVREEIDREIKETCVFLARFYIKEGMSDIERWHNKLAHQGTNILARCNIKDLRIPKQPHRCEHCIYAKMHSGDHSTKTTDRKTDLKPGEYIITDMQGPYARTREGNKYIQIFLDVVSRKVWVAKMQNKTGSDSAIEKVIHESKIRSGNNIKILRTDGDGVFGRSKTFQELRDREKFIHERPAPYDHQQNALIDRECRTLFESVSTSLKQSGAPSSFWGEAADHFVFTRNITPRIKIDEHTYKTPDAILENRDIHFNLKHLVAFGTQATCYIPPERRRTQKTPGQARSYDAVVIGYVKDMQAYIVWDIEKEKKRDVSFFHTIVHEGFYPLGTRVARKEKEAPGSFTELLVPGEQNSTSLRKKRKR